MNLLRNFINLKNKLKIINKIYGISKIYHIFAIHNNKNNDMKAKQLHLTDEVVKTLTIEAAKEGTTFKELAQRILTEKAKKYERNLQNN